MVVQSQARMGAEVRWRLVARLDDLALQSAVRSRDSEVARVMVSRGGTIDASPRINATDVSPIGAVGHGPFEAEEDPPVRPFARAIERGRWTELVSGQEFEPRPVVLAQVPRGLERVAVRAA